uniref:Uncharacterized protein MANES_09G131000 n=1 Tax=Rhizophora mucronata TaxID=61149 RepID=A0A2P2JK95_RHIMU
MHIFALAPEYNIFVTL